MKSVTNIHQMTREVFVCWELRKNLCSTKERKNMLLRGSWSVVFSFSLSFLFRAVAGGSEIWNRAAVQTGLLLAHHTWLTLCQSRHKRKRLRRRHTARPSSLSGMRLRFTGALGTFVHFPLFMAWYCVCLCVSVCVCECVSVREITNTDGVGWHGSRSVGAPRSIKRNKAGEGWGSISAKPTKIKDQVWIQDPLQVLGPIFVEQGVSGGGEGVRDNNQTHHGIRGLGCLLERSCPEPIHAASIPVGPTLKSAYFCSLHNLIWCWKG